MERSVQSYQRLGLVLLAATILCSLSIKAADAQSAQPGSTSTTPKEEPIKRTVLFRGNLEGVEGKEIVIFLAELAPGAVGSKHYHPGPEFFYVLEGTLAHEPEGGPAHLMKPGDLGSNPNKSVHTIRNPSATERSKALDFLLAEKGQPLVIPVK
jgi:quercetin dioxygenase-like cupin family protein